ncbi:MAG: hypothetical protein JRN20_10680 [Nitrososphaerota archaeon]|nr:hypothetical protein [Nitrososphaerota archaeon]MDG6922978.1 hypothetical protein [Nitrososphaerota archaeon]
MGVKKTIRAATARVTTRVRRTGIFGELGRGSATALKTRGIELIYFLAIFLLMAGVINAIGNASQAGINLETIVPNTSVQNTTETFIMLFGYIAGSLGAYSLYLSGRQTIRARSAEMFFVGGIAFVAVAMWLGYYVLHLK